MKVVVTGGAGFIGSEMVRFLVAGQHDVLTIDKLGYSGRPENLASVQGQPNFELLPLDLCDAPGIEGAIDAFEPDVVLHLAAESHVDRSIDGPRAFLDSNVVGTFNLLEAVRRAGLAERNPAFRLVHVSTDEVYGSLGEEGTFTETTPYHPNSPYSATKAASDHLVRAWHHTYGLPVIVTNCSNNYGPYQFPEKLIPLTVMRALAGKPIPIYGDGLQVRDWLHVADHVQAVWLAATRGRPGETYNVGAGCERTNRQIVEAVLGALSAATGRPLPQMLELVQYVTDRPGHDRRYAIDAGKITSELGWAPGHTFEEGIRQTVSWYLQNQDWCRAVSNVYNGERLGLSIAAV